MSLPSQPKSDSLRRLYWRDELLQLLFWIEGEGLGTEVNPDLVDRFLGPDGDLAIHYLGGLVRDGLLEHAGGGYRLARRGREEAARIFADEFADSNHPSHGACGDDCWCRSMEEEAAACLVQRSSRSTWD